MIIVSGFNVYPNELEAVAAACTGVTECACVGRTDEKTGEAVRLHGDGAGRDAGARWGLAVDPAQRFCAYLPGRPARVTVATVYSAAYSMRQTASAGECVHERCAMGTGSKDVTIAA